MKKVMFLALVALLAFAFKKVLLWYLPATIARLRRLTKNVLWL
jgi:hypothetical protein